MLQAGVGTNLNGQLIRQSAAILARSPVGHPVATVPHSDVELPHTALPVLVDTGRAGHHTLPDRGDRTYREEQSR